MDEIPAGTPVPTVEYGWCVQCDSSLYRGVSADGKRRGPWHHHDRRLRHEPVVDSVGEVEAIVESEIAYSAEAAARGKNR